MIRLRVPVTLVLGLTALTQSAMADAELTVRAEEARAEILPRAEDQKYTRLPSLQFSIHAEFACSNDAVAESITVSVADAHERYTPAEGEATLAADITVPRSQIAALTTGDFCMDGIPSKDLLIASVATAQVSLRCRGDSGASVRFASLRLPLRLVCGPGDDQEPSVGASSLAR